ILLPEFSIPAFIPLLIAVATSSVISKALYSEPLFHLVTDDWAMSGLFFYILLALIIGAYSVYFAKLSTYIKRWYDAVKNPYRKVWISGTDRKSTRLNSSHVKISYAVFCLKKKMKVLLML